MPHDAPIHFRDKRDRERFGGAQRGNDKLLRVIADCQGPKRSDCHLGNGADIGVRFTPDVYLVFHVPGFLFFIGQSSTAAVTLSAGAFGWRSQFSHKESQELHRRRSAMQWYLPQQSPF